MAVPEKRTFDLPPEQERYIDALVAAGTFGSVSEVVGAGLQALRERDEAIEAWLQADVLPVYDRMVSDPERGVPVAEVRARLRARHLSQRDNAAL